MLLGGADIVIMVSVAAWFAIGAATLFILSVVVGLLVGAILGSLSRGASELLEAESCSFMPLTARATRHIEAGGEAPSHLLA